MLNKKIASFKYAIKGLKICFHDEVNFQIQIACAVVAIVLGIYFQISTTEWLFIVAISGLVLSAELLNTALEELCDMLKTTHDPHVAKIKDLAAAAVLVASIAAFLVGIIIFLPKFFV